MAKIVRVAVEGLLYSYDRLFDYLLPQELSAVGAGCRVNVPFGAGNRCKQAMVLSVLEDEPEGKLKSVLSAVDEQPLLSQELLELAVWLRERCFCCYYDAVKLLFPAGLDYAKKEEYIVLDPDRCADDELQRSVLAFMDSGQKTAAQLQKAGFEADLLREMVRSGCLAQREKRVRKVGDKLVRMVCASQKLLENMQSLSALKLTPKQRATVEFVLSNGDITTRELQYYTGVGPTVINALLQKELLECYEEPEYRSAYQEGDAVDIDSITLNDGQQAAYDALLKERNQSGAALLFGVTGSGKTMVLLKLVQKMLGEGKSALVMVPEILLTPQFVRLFTGCFGKRVAVIHSGLSMGVRLDEYRRIKNGEADVVIGTRSAVFAPLQNIGLISLDEEQEGAYKSEQSPRFDAREVAAYRAKVHGALLLRMSATPSIRSFHAAESGRAALIRLGGRFGTAKLPRVSVVDMRLNATVQPGGVLGEELLQKLEQNLENGHQSVLLLNRRGHDTVVICFDCGEVLTCPRCSVALNYHSANGRLMCHCCGYSTAEMTCKKCGSKKMRFFGSGTQKVEKELHALLPQARVLRMDTDSAVSRASHDELFSKFGGGEYDILLGTQMVAKGLDFENVTLAGVLNAEQGLFGEDYKGGERTFSLLTQVVGRCGRGKYPGEAVIQTYLPEHRIVEYARNQDYEGFYRDEIALRRQLLHPPFCDLCLIGISGPKKKETEQAAAEFLNRLAQKLTGAELPTRVYGPAEAFTAMAANRYRYRITVKCKNNRAMRAVLAEVLADFSKAYGRQDIQAFADMNPEQIY